MTMLRTLALATFLLLASINAAGALQQVPPDLSLDEAVEIAREHNPQLLRSRNDEITADWQVREAYGQLLPSASASGGVSWQGSGENLLAGSVTLGDLGVGDQPSYYSSRYSLGLNYSLSWATLLGPRQSKATRRTTLAAIEGTDWGLVTQITANYIDVWRQQEAVRIAQLQLENAEFNLRLAQGQLEVGQVTPIDVGQAEVQVGRAEVALLQARNSLTTARMRLLQLMGVPIDQPFDVTTGFELTEPTWEVETLTAVALEENPELKTSRLAAEASAVGVSSAWSPYMPTLSVSAGWSAFTREASSVDFQIAQAQAQTASRIAQCIQTNDLYSRLANPLPPLNCGQIAFTDEQRAAIIAQNDQFPFDFIRSPPSVGLTLSIPIFTGFSRQRALEQARVQAADDRETIRERELGVQADVAIGLETARTAYESAQLEERNRLLAEQQLELARERYQVGQITFVELVDAQTVFAQAEVSRAQAVYDYHDAITNLEALLGTSLRFQD
ncbi:MAG: TolC family protein [Longimicrobiales bacterium]|nr:TolC family protein [Longimicrobiales bacterium]